MTMKLVLIAVVVMATMAGKCGQNDVQAIKNHWNDFEKINQDCGVKVGLFGNGA